MTEPSEEVKEVERRYEKSLDDMEKHYKDVLEQIRNEILNFKEKCNASDYLGCGILEIIDRYTKGEQG